MFPCRPCSARLRGGESGTAELVSVCGELPGPFGLRFSGGTGGILLVIREPPVGGSTPRKPPRFLLPRNETAPHCGAVPSFVFGSVRTDAGRRRRDGDQNAGGRGNAHGH